MYIFKQIKTENIIEIRFQVFRYVHFKVEVRILLIFHTWIGRNLSNPTYSGNLLRTSSHSGEHHSWKPPAPCFSDSRLQYWGTNQAANFRSSKSVVQCNSLGAETCWGHGYQLPSQQSGNNSAGPNYHKPASCWDTAGKWLGQRGQRSHSNPNIQQWRKKKLQYYFYQN